MLPENRSFMIRGEDGQEYGPVEMDELREWVLENRAGLGTEVRLDAPGAPWHPWQTYPELVALLAETQATRPMPGLVVAAIWRRLFAWILDIMLLAIMLNPVQLLLDRVIPMRAIYEATTNPAVLQNMPAPLFHQVVAFVILDNACLVIYFTVFHALYGKTPAKALLRVRVIDAAGQKPTVIKAFVRALALVISVNLIFPLIFAFLNPQRRALHDFVADTCVVDA